MAQPEKYNGRGGQPDRFAGVVQGFFEPHELQQLATQLDGLRGPLEKDIAQWHREGIGRMISVEVPNISNEQVQGGKSRSMAFAIPLTDETVTGHKRRVIVLFASESGSHKVLKLGPRTYAESEDEEDIDIEDENNLIDFDMFFRPSDKPSVVTGWKPRPGENAEKSFQDNLSLLPFVITHFKKKDKAHVLVDKAVTNARRMKIRSIPTDEFSLRNTLDLGSELIAEFEVANMDWEQMRREAQQEDKGEIDPGYPEAA
jgi:hypothetical protein